MAPFPTCHSEAAVEAADNIYSVPPYHANADATCQGCSGRCRARKWGAGFTLGESGLALGSG